MPIYEYQCSSCGHRQEALQKISDSALTECSACHKPSLSKCVSAAGFRLSGNGWYETDFKTGAKKNLSEGDSSASSSTGESTKTSAIKTSSAAPKASAS